MKKTEKRGEVCEAAAGLPLWPGLPPERNAMGGDIQGFDGQFPNHFTRLVHQFAIVGRGYPPPHPHQPTEARTRYIKHE